MKKLMFPAIPEWLAVIIIVAAGIMATHLWRYEINVDGHGRPLEYYRTGLVVNSQFEPIPLPTDVTDSPTSESTLTVER